MTHLRFSSLCLSIRFLINWEIQESCLTTNFHVAISIRHRLYLDCIDPKMTVTMFLLINYPTTWSRELQLHYGSYLSSFQLLLKWYSDFVEVNRTVLTFLLETNSLKKHWGGLHFLILWKLNKDEWFLNLWAYFSLCLDGLCDHFFKALCK